MLDALLAEFGQQVTWHAGMVSDAPDAKVIARVRPADLAAACGLVRFAARHGVRVVPSGGGTKWNWTAPPVAPEIGMDMRSLCGVVDYAPEDMTITVEAGMTLDNLNRLLAERNQRVTLDPPNATEATIGGILAANDSGPIRFAFGTARDIVIGMSMIQPDGTVIKSGGRVVKNVAGYDLHKLYIGSFGTLGPIATVTFKLRPTPEARGLVVMRPGSAAEAERIIDLTLAGETRPTMIELLSPRMARALKLEPALTLILGYEENAEAVAWQCERAAAAFGGTTLDAADSQSLYERLREATGADDVEMAFKASMLSSETAGFVEWLDRWPVRTIARAGNGIVHGLIEEPLAAETWRELEAAVEARNGYLQIRGELPAAVRGRFGRRRGDAFLSEGIRKAFDPAGIFAPERVG